jgi:hypothetical protein
MAKIAEFKTAYLQREIPVMATVAAPLKVGQLCTYNGTALAAVADETTVAVGQYIIAQSDMTMGNGHVPVEQRDYTYSPLVAASTTPKLVALFRVDNPDDLIVKTV